MAECQLRRGVCDLVNVQPVIFFLTVKIMLIISYFFILSDARTRVNLPEIPGDPLSIYINANFLKVRWMIEQLLDYAELLY